MVRSHPSVQAFEELAQETVLALRAAAADWAAVRVAIERYLSRGRALGMNAGELVDAFGVSTPSILESAGYEGAAGDRAMGLFDEVYNAAARPVKPPSPRPAVDGRAP